MRLAHVTLALALAAGPAAAQVLSNPNAANRTLTNESNARSNQIGTTSQNNAARMEMQRSQASQPPAPPSGVVGAPRR